LALKELKMEMCHNIGIEMNEVIVKRGSSNGIEIKDLSLAIKDVGLLNGSKIYLSFGIPSDIDEYRVQISLARLQHLPNIIDN